MNTAFRPGRWLRGFARWFRPAPPAFDLGRLLAEFGVPLSATEPADPVAAFNRVRLVYELRPDVRRVYPLGLTPAQRGDYARWLFTSGRAEYGLRDDEIVCYLRGLAEDPAHGLAETFLLSPEWQRAVPHALSGGWKELKHWVAARHGIRGRWLREAKLPPQYTATPQAAPGVNLLGHFRHESGVQQEVMFYAQAIRDAGYRTLLRDVPVGYPRDWRQPERYLDLERGDISLIKIGAQEPLDAVYPQAGLHPRPGVYRVVCWSWELEQFPADAVARAGLANEIWVPSEFCARAVRRLVTDRPVFVNWPAVVAQPCATLPRSHFGLPEDRFLFAFVFDMGSVMERKNPLAAIAAFRRAFRPGDPAHLVIKVSRASANRDGFAQLTAAAREAGVTVIDRVMPREESLGLIAACDCYVSLHRSEGFGSTPAEAMLLGKPTIATAYSGPLDFLTPHNSFPVEFRLTELDRDYPPYPKGAVWAEPSVEHAAERMRWAFDHRDEARAVGEVARADMAERFSVAATAKRIAARLSSLSGGPNGTIPAG